MSGSSRPFKSLSPRRRSQMEEFDWTYIDEEQKYLRVILLEDGETVHNAFFDRGFKP